MPHPEQATSENIQVRTVGTPQAPSAVRTVPDMAQVQVDQWGHKGEFIRGTIVTRAEADEAQFDWDHAVRMGAIRLLTEAEKRSLPTTYLTLADGSQDMDARRAGRFHAGLTDELAETVTTEGGPSEPAEFSKPTVAFTGENTPAARPVRTVGSAQEAEASGAGSTRVVTTERGPAFESAEERQAREAEVASEPHSARRRARE